MLITANKPDFQTRIYSVDMHNTLIQNVLILPASEVAPELLHAFYELTYPQRAKFLIESWNWLNRSSYLDNKIPLVVLYQGKVIAHAGLIPFDLMITGRTFSAAWFIDLAVLPEYRRHGLAKILVKKRATFSEMQITFPNENSFGIFQRAGWQVNSESFMHYVLISPFNHTRFVRWMPSFLRLFLNAAVIHSMSGIYYKYCTDLAHITLSPLTDRLLVLHVSRYEKSQKEKRHLISPTRNKDYVQWRIQNSPNRSQYFIYSGDEFSALVFLNKETHNSIDVLWVSDCCNIPEIRRMLSSLALYGKGKGFLYVRFYTTASDLSSSIKRQIKSLVKKRKFVFSSKNRSLIDECQTLSWDIELIDSDFEHTN